MPRSRPSYPPEFKAEAVRFYRSDSRSIVACARRAWGCAGVVAQVGTPIRDRRRCSRRSDEPGARGARRAARSAPAPSRPQAGCPADAAGRQRRRLAAQEASTRSGSAGPAAPPAPGPAWGSNGDPYDNAMCESVVSTIKQELLSRQSWKTRDDARLAVFSYIETFYNPRRRHSALDYLSPDEALPVYVATLTRKKFAEIEVVSSFPLRFCALKSVSSSECRSSSRPSFAAAS